LTPETDAGMVTYMTYGDDRDAQEIAIGQIRAARLLLLDNVADGVITARQFREANGDLDRESMKRVGFYVEAR